MLKPELLEILCCPHCRGDLKYDSSHEVLVCTACARSYPVQDGIPIMMSNEGS